MFTLGLKKTAATYAMITPEEYEHLSTSKDPLIGALVGGKAGAAVGALRAAKGKKLQAAIAGELIGNATGAVGGLAVRKARKIYAHMLQNYSKELNLRATPQIRRQHRHGG